MLHGFAGLIDLSTTSSRSLAHAHALARACNLPSPTDGPPSRAWVAHADWIAAAGERCILFDGRLDNRSALGAELGLDPRRTTDRALVAAAFDRWRDDCAARLGGDFALAIWSGSEQRVLLACDPAGLKPLYYAVHDQSVACATTLRVLVRLPWATRQIDERAVVDLLALNHGLEPVTAWRGVSRVAAGTCVVITRDTVRSRRWWSAGVPAPVAPRPDRDCVEATREAFDRAVADRLRADAPVVVAASAGLDSSAIAATAARLEPARTVYVLTAAPSPGAPLERRATRYADERPLVRALGERYPNMNVETFDCSGVDPIERNGAALFERTGLPVAQVSFGWFGAVFRRAAQLGAVTLLVGDMGNAVLSNDGLFRLRELALRGQWLGLRCELLALGVGGDRSGWSWFKSHVAGPLAPPWLTAWRARRRDSLFGNWRRIAAVRNEVATKHDLAARLRENGFPGGDIGQHRGVAPLVDWLSRRRAFLNDWASAMQELHGLEVRDPHGDRRLIAHCAGLPADQFLRAGQRTTASGRSGRRAGVVAAPRCCG
jgi:asparagine synthase (glutamine-hydrolysing)